MPELFPDRIFLRIVITDVNQDSDYVWAHEDREITYKENSKGKKVVKFDPRGVTSLYRKDSLRVVDEKGRPRHVRLFG